LTKRIDDGMMEKKVIFGWRRDHFEAVATMRRIQLERINCQLKKGEEEKETENPEKQRTVDAEKKGTKGIDRKRRDK
jgi:hypothetical protein